MHNTIILQNTSCRYNKSRVTHYSNQLCIFDRFMSKVYYIIQLYFSYIIIYNGIYYNMNTDEISGFYIPTTSVSKLKPHQSHLLRLSFVTFIYRYTNIIIFGKLMSIIVELQWRHLL